MPDRRLLLRVALLVALASAPAPAAQAQNAPPLLTACDRAATVTPERLQLACGDGRLLARDLRWRGWGDAVAEAEGIARIDDCRPRCGTGEVRERPVRLRAQRLRACADGSVRYTLVRRDFPDGEATAEGASPYTAFPCAGPRPELRELLVRLHRRGSRRAGYWLRATVAGRVCAPAGELDLVVREDRTAGGRRRAYDQRIRRVDHRGGCRTHVLRHRLPRGLARPGVLRVRLTVWNDEGAASRTRTRRFSRSRAR